jgi:hypothetical protein
VAMSLSAIMFVGRCFSCELVYVNAGVDELQLAVKGPSQLRSPAQPRNHLEAWMRLERGQTVTWLDASTRFLIFDVPPPTHAISTPRKHTHYSHHGRGSNHSRRYPVGNDGVHSVSYSNTT